MKPKFGNTGDVVKLRERWTNVRCVESSCGGWATLPPNGYAKGESWKCPHCGSTRGWFDRHTYEEKEITHADGSTSSYIIEVSDPEGLWDNDLDLLETEIETSQNEH